MFFARFGRIFILAGFGRALANDPGRRPRRFSALPPLERAVPKKNPWRSHHPAQIIGQSQADGYKNKVSKAKLANQGEYHLHCRRNAPDTPQMKYRYSCEKCGRVHILPWEAERSDGERKNRLHKCECGLYASLPDRIGPGVIIDSYEILARLGKGGMGTVWRARQHRKGSGKDWSREVALKIWEPAIDGADNQFTRNLFVSEAQTLAEIQHPNVVTIHDFGTGGDVLYLVMELIKGRTLEQLLETTVFSEVETLHFAYTIAMALGDCWDQHRLLHRDLKPGNLILDRSNHLHILDLGLSRVGESRRLESIHGLAIGTPNYMSPEQSRGDDVDTRSDIYALGCSMFHLLTGKRPFSGMSRTEIIKAQRKEPVPGPHNDQPDVSDACRRILERMTEKEPDNRYRSWGELTDELKVLLRRFPSSISAVDEEVLGSEGSSSISTVVRTKAFPFTKSRSERTPAGPPAARAPSRKARKEATPPRTHALPAGVPPTKRKRGLMPLLLAIPLVLGLLIGVLVMRQPQQTEAVHNQIVKRQKQIVEFEGDLKSTGILTGKRFARIDAQLVQATSILINDGDAKRALEKSESAWKEFEGVKAQYGKAETSRKQYLAANVGMPALVADFPTNVVSLYRSSKEVGKMASNQFYSANFPEANRNYLGASYTAYQVVPTLALEDIAAPIDAAWEAGAPRWASEEWNEATNVYGQAAAAIPNLQSQNVDDILADITVASNRFAEAARLAPQISNDFVKVATLAGQLEEPLEELEGPATQRIEFLQKQMALLTTINGAETEAEVMSFLKDSAYCEATSRYEKGVERGMNDEDIAKVEQLFHDWRFSVHVVRCNPAGEGLGDFEKAVEKWQEGMRIQDRNQVCKMQPMSTQGLDALATKLAGKGNGLTTLKDWKAYQETLHRFDADDRLKLKEAVDQSVDKAQRDHDLNIEWTGITNGIDKAELLVVKQKLKDADDFLLKHQGFGEDGWVDKKRKDLLCGKLAPIMGKLKGDSLEDVAKAIKDHKTITLLRELSADAFLGCPDQQVRLYVREFDEFSNFVYSVTNVPEWELGAPLPIEDWANYYRPVEDLTTDFSRVVDPKAFTNALSITLTNSILPGVRAKVGQLPNEKADLRALDIQLLVAASAISNEPLLDALNDLREQVAKKLKKIDAPPPPLPEIKPVKPAPDAIPKKEANPGAVPPKAPEAKPVPAAAGQTTASDVVPKKKGTPEAVQPKASVPTLKKPAGPEKVRAGVLKLAEPPASPEVKANAENDSSASPSFDLRWRGRPPVAKPAAAAPEPEAETPVDPGPKELEAKAPDALPEGVIQAQQPAEVPVQQAPGPARPQQGKDVPLLLSAAKDLMEKVEVPDVSWLRLGERSKKTSKPPEKDHSAGTSP